MTLARIPSLALLAAALAAGAAEKDSFDLPVKRVRLPRMFRNQAGKLHIDAQGITFRSSDGKTRITIRMEDLREADVADSHALRFQSYAVEKWKPMLRREYTFRAEQDAPVEEIAHFLAARVYRPVGGH